MTHRLFIQILFALKIAVKVAAGHVELPGNIVQGGFFKTIVGKDRQRGIIHFRDVFFLNHESP